MSLAKMRKIFSILDMHQDGPPSIIQLMSP